MSTINKEQKAEERAYQQDMQERLNNVMKIHNPQKKQEKYRELFPLIELNDEWLSEAVVF